MTGERKLQEMQSLINDLQVFKTKAMEENRNLTTTINIIKARNEETTQVMNEMKETLANLSRIGESTGTVCRGV